MRRGRNRLNRARTAAMRGIARMAGALEARAELADPDVCPGHLRASAHAALRDSVRGRHGPPQRATSAFRWLRAQFCRCSDELEQTLMYGPGPGLASGWLAVDRVAVRAVQPGVAGVQVPLHVDDEPCG